MEHDQAQAFLWEKYTTHPFTEQQKCRYIDEVVTPWPCFVIAVREEVLEKYPALLKEMCYIVNQKAKEVKLDEDSVEVISWRYNLRSGQVANWLIETDWNYDAIEYPLAFDKTVRYLKQLDLTKKYPLIQEGEKLKFTYLKMPNHFKNDVISFPGRIPKEFELDNYIDYDLQFDKAFLEPIRDIS